MTEMSQMHVPEGWSSNELGKLIIERKKSALKVSDAANFGQYPFFTSGETVLHHVDKLTGGENIYLATGGVANIKFFDGDASYSTDTYTVRTNDEIETKYLYFDLLSIIDYINANYFQGSGLKHLQKKDFKKHRILYPKERIEQNQIVTILSKVDEAISQTDKLIAKYSRIKTGLMQDLLTKGIDEKGNIRSEETHEFKDSPLGRIPMEWDCVQLEKLNELITSGSRGWAKYYAEEGSQFIRITNLKRKQIDIDKSDLKFVNLPLSAEGIRSKLIEGDLLISITADLGIIGVIPSDFGNAFINQHIALVRLDQKFINSKFAGYFLSSQIGQSMFNFLNDGGAKAGLNLKTISQLFVIKPRMAEQKLIVEKIEKQNNDVMKLKQQLSKLQSIKTGLMQDLLSGKVRVNHLVKESTSI
jgi:type I restriction enzyme S subunit